MHEPDNVKSAEGEETAETPAPGDSTSAPAPLTPVPWMRVSGLLFIAFAVFHLVLCMRNADIGILRAGTSAIFDVSLFIWGVSQLVRSTGRHVSRKWAWAAGGLYLFMVFCVGLSLFNAAQVQVSDAVATLLPAFTTVAYCLLLVWAVRLLCGLRLSLRAQILLAATALVLYSLTNATLWQMLADFLSFSPHASSFLISHSPQPGQPTISFVAPVLLILFGATLGQIMARLIREQAILLPVLLIAAMVDFWAVYWGTVKDFMLKAPDFIPKVASVATVTAPGPPVAVMHTLPPVLQMVASVAPPDSIGLGDFVFLAFFLTAAAAVGISVRRSMWGVFAGLMAYAILDVFSQQKVLGLHLDFSYIPGLVFISGGMLVANLFVWRLKWQEWLMTAGLVAVMAGVIGFTAWQTGLTAPREMGWSITLQAKDERDLISKMVTALTNQERKRAQKKGADASLPVQVLPIRAFFRYTVVDGHAQLYSTQMLLLGRPANVESWACWEYNFGGQRQGDTTQWNLMGPVRRPADDCLDELRQSPTATGSDEDVLVGAKGLPEAAFKVLDQKDDFAAKLSKHPWFLIELHLDEMDVDDDSGATVQTIPLTASPATAKGP